VIGIYEILSGAKTRGMVIRADYVGFSIPRQKRAIKRKEPAQGRLRIRKDGGAVRASAAAARRD
jgi:hypothetical protein